MSHNAISLSLCFDQDKIYVVSPSQNIFPLCQDRCAVLQDILIHKYSLISHSDHLPPPVYCTVCTHTDKGHRKVQKILCRWGKDEDQWLRWVIDSSGATHPGGRPRRALIKGVLTYLRFHALGTLPNHTIPNHTAPKYTTQHHSHNKPYPTKRATPMVWHHTKPNHTGPYHTMIFSGLSFPWSSSPDWRWGLKSRLGRVFGSRTPVRNQSACFHLCSTVHAMLFTYVVHIIEHSAIFSSVY